jgi:hypothetical protein
MHDPGGVRGRKPFSNLRSDFDYFAKRKGAAA